MMFEKPRNRRKEPGAERKNPLNRAPLEGLDVVAALAGQMFPVLGGDFTYAAWWTAAVCGFDETCAVKEWSNNGQNQPLFIVIYIY